MTKKVGEGSKHNNYFFKGIQQARFINKSIDFK